ncbi:hypothetical protein CFN79_09415 [Chromobacterium vaccinii]|uniref:hypothetical protein n=1 Tax=Chromobacterium vaccinii TaxID=1108595 RepID=UPI000CE9A613|nr:hypothetical protein [Chromobacterium vaccinii]AVG16054.1 hypothetical protein CFN79_09415 [Chromobacterium vaccinii]
MNTSDIESRYAWQFRGGRGIDNCVPPAWLPIVEKLCHSIDEIVSPADRTGFYWLDIKEKRGTLAVDFVVPASMGEAIEALVDTAITQATCITEQH